MTNNKNRSNDELLKSIYISVEGMKIALPKDISAGTFSVIAKTPFKVHSLREALFYRVSNICDTSLELLKNDEFIPALILIRSLLECAAVMRYLKNNVEKCILNKKIGDFDDKIMKMLLGSRDDTTTIQAINVLTIIDNWEKEMPNIRKMYDDLSEYTHPNWLGVQCSYGIIDLENLKVEYRKNTDRDSWPYRLALISLDGFINFFILYYDDIVDLLQDFAELCEIELENKNKD